MPTVVILDKADTSIEERVLRAALGAGVELEVLGLDLRTQAAALASPKLATADIVVVWHTLQIDAAMVAAMPKAIALVRVGVGYDNCDLPALAAAGLPCVNVPNYGTEEVADHALSLLLCLLRRTVASFDAVRAGVEAHGSDGVARVGRGTRRLRGLTLGLVGCGRIGTAMALRAKACGLDVVFYDPHAPAGLDKALGIRRAPSPLALAAQAHCVSAHCDLNETSRHIIDAAFLAAMPPGGFVVNTARGGVVDEPALLASLRSGHTAGAGIDVHEKEPFLGTDASQPLAAAPNCINTPHSAFFSDEGWVEMREIAATSAAHALLGTPLANAVNARLLLAQGKPPRCPIVAPRD
jgi:phosphoglycerate dehydrogenase-like enzyme